MQQLPEVYIARLADVGRVPTSREQPTLAAHNTAKREGCDVCRTIGLCRKPPAINNARPHFLHHQSLVFLLAPFRCKAKHDR